ncbi:hypothetical protein ABKN59_004303 [Abortiporus biennis]
MSLSKHSVDDLIMDLSVTSTIPYTPSPDEFDQDIDAAFNCITTTTQHSTIHQPECSKPTAFTHPASRSVQTPILKPTQNVNKQQEALKAYCSLHTYCTGFKDESPHMNEDLNRSSCVVMTSGTHSSVSPKHGH